MSFEFQIFGGDKGHHAKAHSDAGHKLHDEAHKLFDKLHHSLEKAKPVIHQVGHEVEKQAKPIIHQVGHEAERQAKPYIGAAKREIHGNATPEDKHRLETVGKVAATVFLPHVVIGTEIAKKGIEVIKHSNIKTNVHVEHHTPVNHGDSKQ
ncbi:MAG TPA: hypothetical protein V6C76_03870 [Drouetiella sp.]